MRSAFVLVAALSCFAFETAAGQDFRVLHQWAPASDPRANLFPQTLPPGVATLRVLIAGDSWAQYMWDDGTHNAIFDRYGHAEKRAVSRSRGSDPGPGYTGPEYAISGSEARQWVDTGNYPWIANMVADLNANPSIDRVVLSIGGNDVLAGKSEGGWYKDMDLDVPGSEAAFFDNLRDDTETIINAALAVRPNLGTVISSYDYPNFNTSLCFLYACPKRQDLSRDPVNGLITDAELNALMIEVEGLRIGWRNAQSRVDFDNSVGLMHYFYGDGVSGPRVLPRPGMVPPDYAPFPGGNPQRPTLRSNFRNSFDPIHLSVEGYQYKVVQQTEAIFLPHFRGDALMTFFSRGGMEEGWIDYPSQGTAAIRLGDTSSGIYRSILSFDTSAIPDDATVTAARFYVTRTGLIGVNPFSSGALGIPQVDVMQGTFGDPILEADDAFTAATASNSGFLAGNVASNGDAVGVEITGAGLAAINRTGLTQFRLYFPNSGSSSGSDAVSFSDGDDPGLPGGFFSLAAYMGTSAPFLDVSYTVPTGVGDEVALQRPQLLPSSPNPFRASTSLRFVLEMRTHVTLRIYDVQGRLTATLLDEVMDAGGHVKTWNGADIQGQGAAAGIYVAVLQAGDTRHTQRLVRLPGFSR
ncbi:MAG TPA: T9SS type A sorting domain-containing protein [Candidatus Eisenbacteria bacterium]|nr:T9SS type A sorting domain-containing protein [Candidatus Eisenbacteria bacterium]